MLLLSVYCFDCDSWWVRTPGTWAVFHRREHPCIFCGSDDVKFVGHDDVAERELRAEAA